jgi:hypothetical protein
MGEMFLWCRGVERLGLNELGYGYTGKGGATMRRYVESVVNIGWPRTDIPGGLPHYPQITMGDARGASLAGAPPYVFQKSIVDGFLPGGSGGNRRWMAANMNGRDHKNAKVDKMLAPHWFELAHAKWPEGKFDYFLAQMRKPGEAVYTPSLFWGVVPIEASRVSPPPAPSYLARERGFVFLRAEESPAYWESSAPAVALQLATYYVHYAHDAFSLLGLHAFNRPIYLNRQISNGYGGGCPWTDSGRGHCGVMVDNLHYELNDTDAKRDHPHWPNPIGEVPTRNGFDSLVKFISACAKPVGGRVSLDNRQPLAAQTLSLELRREEKEVWPGVDMERALFLTREYLFDVMRLRSDRPRQYDWQVHALGQLAANDDWKPDVLGLDQLYAMTNRAIARLLADPVEAERYGLKDVRRLEADGAAWTATIRQDCALTNVADGALGRAWYERQIGVRVHMLGEAGTTVFAGRSPESRRVPGKEANKGDKSNLPNEVGGTTLLVRRTAPATVFAAVHEPFEKNTPRLASVTRLAQGKDGVAVAVRGQAGTGINDRLLYSFWDSHTAPVTVEADGESFTFTDRAFVRISTEKVEASGHLRRLRLRVTGRPQFVLNGLPRPARVAEGILILDE